MSRPKTTTFIKEIRKRDGSIVPFNIKKIERAIWQAAKAAGGEDRNRAKFLAGEVVKELERRFNKTITPSVEQVQDIVEHTLLDEGHTKTHKAYILYRDLHTKLRDITSLVDSDELIEKYLKKASWLVKENANMTYSLQGLNNHVASIISANFWLNKIYPKEIRKAHTYGDIHIHDLASLSAYCCGWDLKDLLVRGFGGVQGKLNSKPPSHFSTALGQLVNFLYSLQGEVAGAVAVANFDTYLAPFIAHDNLSYKQVKQQMQEFVYNMNVPCYDDQTEVLTKDGFKLFKELEKDDEIATLKGGKYIEYHKPKERVKYPYTSKMVHVKTTRLDLMVTPNHKMLVSRQKGSGRKLIKVRADELKYDDWIPKTGIWKGKEKSHFNLPALTQKEKFYSPLTKSKHSKTREWKEKKINMDNWLAFLGIYLAEGYAVKETSAKAKEGNYEVGIVNTQKKKQVRKIMENTPFKYRETEDRFIILDKQLWKYLRKLGDCYTKYIPREFKNLCPRQLRILLDAFNIGDGSIDDNGKRKKYYTSSKKIQDDIGELILKVGKSPRYFSRKNREKSINGRILNPSKKHPNLIIMENRSKHYTFNSKKFRRKDGYANFKRVPYKGYVYCVEIPNHVVFVRRNGTCAWSGNTRVGFQSPFSNVTIDLQPPKQVGDEAVIIGGKPINKQYKDFQKEMDMFNRAFAQTMSEGDAQGRVFTFPIPTYSVTKDFDWSNPVLEPVFEMTRKYGIPYFANYINSDMDPDDIRSMCCRLRINNKTLRKRGGLFAANPLTGSLGVVTINLPRIGHTADNEYRFFQRLGKLMRIAKESLLIKRETVENFTNQGLYPYCKYYLQDVKKRMNQYWGNHFNTIGINGMNEALVNFLGKDITTTEGKRFALKIMTFMRKKLLKYQKETDQLFNLEATPAEGTAYRFAKIDKEKFGDNIKAANEVDLGNGVKPFYTNSTHLPVDATKDLFEALNHQDDLQCKYNGGTVFHGFLGESPPNTKVVKKLIQKISKNYNLPYFTLTPTFSICPIHGYIPGEHKYCPKCDEEIGHKNL